MQQCRVRGMVAKHHGPAAHQHPHGTGGQDAPALGKTLAAQGSGIDTEHAGQHVGDALRYVIGLQQREHCRLDTLRNAGCGASRLQHAGCLALHVTRMRPLGAQHGGHMICEHVAMHPRRRLQASVELLPLDKERRVRAQVCGNAVGVGLLRAGGSVYHLSTIHKTPCRMNL